MKDSPIMTNSEKQFRAISRAIESITYDSWSLVSFASVKPLTVLKSTLEKRPWILSAVYYNKGLRIYTFNNIFDITIEQASHGPIVKSNIHRTTRPGMEKIN